MTASHDDQDAWEAARARSREDVRAAFAPRTATCPSCSATVEADTRTCPNCGASLIETRPKWRPTRRGAATGLAAVVVVGAVVAILVGSLRDDAASERRTAAERQKQLVAAEVQRLTKLGLPRRATGPVARSGESTTAYRERLVAAGEDAITADARKRQPDDPPLGTYCRPTPTGPTRAAQEADPLVASNRYACVAYEHQIELSKLHGKERTGVFGTPYWLVADYDTGALTLCRMTPRGGEGAKTLANVPVDVACRDPFGRQSRN